MNLSFTKVSLAVSSAIPTVVVSPFFFFQAAEGGFNMVVVHLWFSFSVSFDWFGCDLDMAMLLSFTSSIVGELCFADTGSKKLTSHFFLWPMLGPSVKRLRLRGLIGAAAGARMTTISRTIAEKTDFFLLFDEVMC